MKELMQEAINHKNFYNGVLCQDPTPLPGQAEPEIIFYSENDIPFEYSVVVPVFNQEAIIEKNIQSIIENMDSNFEFILILDNCVDNTKGVVLDYFENNTFPNIAKVVVVEQNTPVFETTCDNIGFVLSSGKYIVEIQADMEMVEYGFNSNLARGLQQYDDVIGVSGRCTHVFGTAHGVGKLGEYVEKTLDPSLDRNVLYMYGTCNRGPLILDRDKLKYMKYMDEQNYFLDASDHDLFARAYAEMDWRCGYIPMEFESPLVDGSTRKDLPADVRELNQHFLSLKKERSGNGFADTFRQQIGIESRVLR
jgi:glycosyltransferase involved in cell wall biosynthesis|tara:strand:- start:1653 stop:2576 length:924 start_codon:yes stop_codon:yes gene_type:complete